MALVLTPAQRDDLETAAAAERHTRTWKRYRALLLRGELGPLAGAAASAGVAAPFAGSVTGRDAPAPGEPRENRHR